MVNLQKNPILAVLGPTASGKTSLALELAERFNGEIVNCDSRQIYNEMSIGTAHPTEDEMRRVPHQLYSFVSPDKNFSAADYVEATTIAIRQIWQRHKTPIVTGGTGFYYDALAQGLGPAGNDVQLAERLRSELQSNGLAVMLERLHSLDPAASSLIDTNNSRRVLRAIEIIMTTGKPLAENKKIPPLPEAVFMPIVVTRPREELHNAIIRRINQMIETGLENEVRRLVQNYGRQAPGLNSIGYCEWFDFLDGKTDMAEVREAIVIHTRQYAKRQETWFRRRPGPPIHDLSEAGILEAVFKIVAEFLSPFAL